MCACDCMYNISHASTFILSCLDGLTIDLLAREQFHGFRHLGKQREVGSKVKTCQMPKLHQLHQVSPSAPSILSSFVGNYSSAFASSKARIRKNAAKAAKLRAAILQCLSAHHCIVQTPQSALEHLELTNHCNVLQLISLSPPLPRKTSAQRVAATVFPKVWRSFHVQSSGRFPIQILGS